MSKMFIGGKNTTHRPLFQAIVYCLKVKSLLWESDMVCCLEDQLLNTFESETRPENKGCTFCLFPLTVFI